MHPALSRAQRDASRANSPGVLLIDHLKERAESSGKVCVRREGEKNRVWWWRGRGKFGALSVGTILNNERFLKSLGTNPNVVNYGNVSRTICPIFRAA